MSEKTKLYQKRGYTLRQLKSWDRGEEPMSNDQAFNEGADSRLRGEPLSGNPYKAKGREMWAMGWRSVDREWGLDVKRRTAPPLPPVQEEEAA